jgi:hypothetical protein
MAVRIPNFFIVGAPKCGTSSLSEHLRNHPNVFFSPRKELNFLNDDLPQEDVSGLYRISTLRDYLKYFVEANENHLAVGEGTPHYLRSRTAIPNILDLNPEARLIAMVRNPIDLVHSFHATRVYEGLEDVVDFEEAWRKQDERRRGRSIPKFCLDESMLLYSEIGLLGKQLQRMFSFAPAEQVKVVVFDDFVRSPKEAYEGVLSFLELPNDGRTEFPKLNPNMHRRSRFLQRGVGYAIRNTMRTKRVLGIRRGLGVLNRISKSNTKVQPRPPLSASFEAELRDFYKEDVELLSQLLDRDLAPWLRGESIAELR